MSMVPPNDRRCLRCGAELRRGGCVEEVIYCAARARPVADPKPAPRVVHCKREPYDIYIGRPSKWGNPFRLAGEEHRLEAIDLYRGYVTGDPQGRLLARQARTELKGKTLGCWCAPKPCHGDVLLEIANAE